MPRGGARVGAGRKPKPRPEPVLHPAIAKAALGAEKPPVGDPGAPVDMLKLLQDVALGRVNATPIQVRAAIAAVQYTHTKKHDGGKKEDQAAAAEAAAAGRFGARAAPLKLVKQG